MQVSTKSRNIASGKYARIRRLTIFGLVSISSFGISVRGQTRAEAQENAGQQVIRVWKAGSPHRGDIPDNRVRFDLQQRAAKLGCRLEIRVMPARDLSGLMSNALATNDEPDILVIDNMGLIVGITTPLGRFDGIGRDPRVRAALLNVSESFRPLETHPGWEYLIKTSRNFLQAKALATMEPDCNLEYGKSGPWTGELRTEIEQSAETVASAYFGNDLTALNAFVGGRYLDDSEPFREANSVISQIKVCGGWGNSRLAFVDTVTSFENTSRLGTRNLLEVLAKAENGWKLLSLGEDPRIIKVLEQQAPTLKTTGDAGSELHAAMLLGPTDGAFFKRWPVEERPELEWARAGNGSIVYLIEAQFTNPRPPQGQSEILWSDRGFNLVPSVDQDALTIKAKATFGAGQQPHRWRIWAIDENGFTTRSEWRVVNYLN